VCLPLERPRELLKEVTNAAWSASQVVEQVRSHQSPAQTRTHAHRDISVRHADNVLIDQIGYFPVEQL
jgi:hypothetical protein